MDRAQKKAQNGEREREKGIHMIEMKTVLWMLILKRVIYFCQ